MSFGAISACFPVGFIIYLYLLGLRGYLVSFSNELYLSMMEVRTSFLRD